MEGRRKGERNKEAIRKREEREPGKGVNMNKVEVGSEIG